MARCCSLCFSVVPYLGVGISVPCVFVFGCMCDGTETQSHSQTHRFLVKTRGIAQQLILEVELQSIHFPFSCFDDIFIQFCML